MHDQGMDTFIARIRIGADRHVRLDFDVPASFPVGEAEAAVRMTSLATPESAPHRLEDIRGKGRGRFWMSDDFDAPLEEFAEYM